MQALLAKNGAFGGVRSEDSYNPQKSYYYSFSPQHRKVNSRNGGPGDIGGTGGGVPNDDGIMSYWRNKEPYPHCHRTQGLCLGGLIVLVFVSVVYLLSAPSPTPTVLTTASSRRIPAM